MKPRLSTFTVISPLDLPSDSCFAIENGKEMPARKRNSGKIKS
jgi:hypothetical protein